MTRSRNLRMRSSRATRPVPDDTLSTGHKHLLQNSMSPASTSFITSRASENTGWNSVAVSMV